MCKRGLTPIALSPIAHQLHIFYKFAGESFKLTIMEFAALIVTVSALLTIILFFKVWGMCNDVDRIMSKVTNTAGEKDITVLIIQGKYDEAEAILNKTIATHIARMYKPDTGLSDLTIEKHLEYMFKEYEPYYKKMGRNIPDILKNTTAADVMEWYKYYEGRVE